jgi:uroporphyrin-3 C-methyltransferase
MDEEDSDVASPPMVTAAAPVPVPSQPATAARRGGTLALLIALVALFVAGFALWRVIVIERGQSDAASSLRADLDARIDDLSRAVDQRKRDFDTVRQRVADADSVNKSMREELLALGERSRHLEDAVANLADQRLTGRDALALNEAEFLLQLAGERLALFHDAKAALAAYRLADSALASAEDPVFSGVRQTIGAEMQALAAATPLETTATLAALERVRESVATLPAKTAPTAAEPPPSKLAALLRQFVRIDDASGAAPESRDPALARSLVAIELRGAESALLARDPETYAASLKRAKAAISTSFDAQSESAKQDLAELDRLASAPLAPSLPELGSALRELRNLRATRALSQPHAAAPAAGAGT